MLRVTNSHQPATNTIPTYTEVTPKCICERDVMCVYVGIFFDIPAAGGVLCASLASLGVPCDRVQGGGAGRRPSAAGLQPVIESLIYYGTGEVPEL